MLYLQACFQIKVITFKYHGLIKDIIASPELIYTTSLIVIQPCYFTRCLLKVSLMCCLGGHSLPSVGRRKDILLGPTLPPYVIGNKNYMDMRLKGARYLSWICH